MACASEPSITCYFTQLPNLIENSGCQRSLVLRQQTTVVLLHDIRRILNGLACLLIGSGLLQDMCRKNVPQVMRFMRQQALDRTAFGMGVVDPIALDDGPPRLLEGGRYRRRRCWSSSRFLRRAFLDLGLHGGGQRDAGRCEHQGICRDRVRPAESVETAFDRKRMIQSFRMRPTGSGPPIHDRGLSSATPRISCPRAGVPMSDNVRAGRRAIGEGSSAAAPSAGQFGATGMT